MNACFFRYMSCPLHQTHLGMNPPLDTGGWWSCCSSVSSSNTTLPTELLRRAPLPTVQIKESGWKTLKKFWKYFMNFIFEISIINSLLLWMNTPGTAKLTKHYSLNDFSLDIAHCLIGDFSSRKGLQQVQPRGRSVSRAGISRHMSVKLGEKKRRCRWCSSQGQRHETIFGCNVCNIYLCRGACFQMYHIHNQLHHDKLYMPRVYMILCNHVFCICIQLW